MMFVFDCSPAPGHHCPTVWMCGSANLNDEYRLYCGGWRAKKIWVPRTIQDMLNRFNAVRVSIRELILNSNKLFFRRPQAARDYGICWWVKNFLYWRVETKCSRIPYSVASVNIYIYIRLSPWCLSRLIAVLEKLYRESVRFMSS